MSIRCSLIEAKARLKLMDMAADNARCQSASSDPRSGRCGRDEYIHDRGVFDK
jgi:hypothetical protein